MARKKAKRNVKGADLPCAEKDEKTGMIWMGEVCRSRFTLLFLTLLFMVLGGLFYFTIVPKALMYSTLLFFAVAWFVLEFYAWKDHMERVKKAVLVGLFLMLFDFVVENSGAIFGLWMTHDSLFAIGIVPIEIMLVCLIGGTAWALYLPRKFDAVHSIVDILVFAFFGAMGENLLGLAGLMSYYQWWNFGWAVLAYALTWAILHFVKYKVVKV